MTARSRSQCPTFRRWMKAVHQRTAARARRRSSVIMLPACDVPFCSTCFSNDGRPGCSRSPVGAANSGHRVVCLLPLHRLSHASAVMDTPSATFRVRKRSTVSPNSSSEPRRHASKACEHCRGRRIKCVGGIPCEACRKSCRERDCHVRVKARPGR